MTAWRHHGNRDDRCGLAAVWRGVHHRRPGPDYERFGVPSYWMIDPDLDRPALSAFELADGAYAEVTHVTGDQVFQAERPFRVQVMPSRLVAKLRSG